MHQDVFRILTSSPNLAGPAKSTNPIDFQQIPRVHPSRNRPCNAGPCRYAGRLITTVRQNSNQYQTSGSEYRDTFKNPSARNIQNDQPEKLYRPSAQKKRNQTETDLSHWRMKPYLTQKLKPRSLTRQSSQRSYMSRIVLRAAHSAPCMIAAHF